MAEAGPKVACNQRRVGGLQIGADYPAPISTSQFLRPVGVRLVFSGPRLRRATGHPSAIGAPLRLQRARHAPAARRSGRYRSSPARQQTDTPPARSRPARGRRLGLGTDAGVASTQRSGWTPRSYPASGLATAARRDGRQAPACRAPRAGSRGPASAGFPQSPGGPVCGQRARPRPIQIAESSLERQSSGAHVSCTGPDGRDRSLISMPERVASRRPRRYGANALIRYPTGGS